MNEIDAYITDLSSRLHVGGRTRRRILAEARDHLDAAATRRLYHVADGDDGEDARTSMAMAMAIEDFGAATSIATQFNAAAGTYAMRRAPLVVLAASIAVLGGFLLAATTQSHPATRVSATLATQVAFLVAVFAFQIAVVAGLCAVSRALSLWRTPVAGGDDRQFVHRSALISTGALGVSALAWSTTMVSAYDRLTHPNTATLVAGGAVMIGTAVVALALVRHLPVNPRDDDRTVNPADNIAGTLAWGEALVAVSRRHPVVVCAVIATLTALPAMAHAETTLSGAIPRGLIQAAAVVVGFVVLGPTLHLRTSDRT